MPSIASCCSTSSPKVSASIACTVCHSRCTAAKPPSANVLCAATPAATSGCATCSRMARGQASSITRSALTRCDTMTSATLSARCRLDAGPGHALGGRPATPGRPGGGTLATLAATRPRAFGVDGSPMRSLRRCAPRLHGRDSLVRRAPYSDTGRRGRRTVPAFANTPRATLAHGRLDLPAVRAVRSSRRPRARRRAPAACGISVDKDGSGRHAQREHRAGALSAASSVQADEVHATPAHRPAGAPRRRGSRATRITTTPT